MVRALLALLLVSSCAFADSAVTHLLELKEYAKIKDVGDALDGVLGVATIDLTNGRVLVYNGDAVFPTASSIKIAIMIQAFRDADEGKLSFDRKITIAPSEDVGGSTGPLADALAKKSPVTLTVAELIGDMIEYSDNTATNKVIDLVGMDRVDATLAQFGFVRTRLRRKMMDVDAAAHGRENISSPLEMARLVRLIYDNQAASAQSCAHMLDIMKRVNLYMRPMIPESIPVASKPGELDGVRTETGLVYLPNRPFIVSVMSTYLTDRANPVPQITAIVFDFFNRLAHSNPEGRRLD